MPVFGFVDPFDLIAIVDSRDHLSIAVVSGNAAEELQAIWGWLFQ